MKGQFLFLTILMFILACNNNANKTTEAEKIPQSADEWFNLAMKEKDTTLSISYYTNAINFGPKNFLNYCSAFNNRATHKKDLGDYRGAIQDYTSAIQNGDADKNDTYYYRGYCKFYVKDFKGAILDFDTVLMQESDLMKESAFLNKGLILFNSGDTKNACINWSSAGELGSKDAYDLIRQHCNK